MIYRDRDTQKILGSWIGKTLTDIKINKNNPREIDSIDFTFSDNEKYSMYHVSDCCSGAAIEDICGDIEDLIGNPILLAEQSESRDFENRKKDYDSCTWTFYKFSTVKGSVTIRWLGESNGYYSESVDIEKL